MTEVHFYHTNEIKTLNLQFAVIAARYGDKWVFSQHRERTTWEIPGGHIEGGETPEEAAKRELYEETGALEAVLQAVAPYGVTIDGLTTYGMLFFAEISKLRSLPEHSEIGKITFRDKLPENLTYPEIQPVLFLEVQKWRTMQSGAGELWDIYDEKRRLTGRTHRRGEPMKLGDYHLCVHIWMRNSRGEFLITKRSPNKGFPNMWESTGGSALSGDDSLTAAVREVREETGLALDSQKGERIMERWGDHYVCDVWLFRQDFDLRDVVLQEGETCDVMYAAPATILKMEERGEFVPQTYMKELFATIGDLE